MGIGFLLNRSGLLRHIRILLILTLSVAWQGALATDANLGYHYLFVNGKGGFEDWTGDIATGLVSPQLDLAGIEPHVFIPRDSPDYSTTLSVSSDGIHFIEIREQKLPNNTRYIMIQRESGKLPGMLLIYDGDETIYEEDVKYNLSESGYSDYIKMTALPDGGYSGSGKISMSPRDKGFLMIGASKDDQYFIDGEKLDVIFTNYNNTRLLLPKGTHDFELKIISDSPTPRGPGITSRYSESQPSGLVLSPDLNNYIDWDGDGKLEVFGYDRLNTRNFGKFDISDGVISTVHVANSLLSNHIFLGMDADGYVITEYRYGSNTDSNAKRGKYILKLKNFWKEFVVAQDCDEDDKIFPADVSLNGGIDYLLTNYVYVNPHSVTLHPDGSTTTTQINCMTPGEYAGKRSELVLDGGQQGIPGMGDMIIRPGQVSYGLVDTPSLVDINSDGLFDVIAGGKYYVNAGNGDFVEYTYSDFLCVRDVTGDGINDLLCWNDDSKSLTLYVNGDTSNPVILIQNMAALKNSSCNFFVRDVDNDGDLDIVLVSVSSYNQSYVIILENTGGGKFRKREHALGEGSNSLISLYDYDSDGKYELLFTSSSSRPMSLIKIESCDKLGQPVDVGQKVSDPCALKGNHADGWSIVQYIDRGYKIVKQFDGGSRPDKPAKPTLVYDAATQRLSVSWLMGKDNETPALDLTYELRIGTAPGAGDIAVAQALPDGTRKNLRRGREGYSTHRTFDTSSWPEGNVYISYQVIDDGYCGSEFSDPAVFVKSDPASGFKVNGSDNVTKDVPVELIPQFTPQQGIKYTWTISDGEIVSQDEITQAATVIFHNAGKNSVTLTAETADGSKGVTTKTIDVLPVDIIENQKLVYDRYSIYNQYELSYSFVIDLDGDGYHEPNAKYKENASGRYEPITKTFAQEDVRHIADVNCDGLADLYYYKTFLLNYGDGDMEKTERQPLKNYGWSYDLDNDGYLDNAYDIKYNDGTYTGVVDTDWLPSPWFYQYGFVGPRLMFYDFNGDGLLDVCSMGASSTSPFEAHITDFYIYESIDGRSFKPGRMIQGISGMPALIDDIDGDGKADFVFTGAGFDLAQFYDSDVTIKWGSGAPDTRILCPDADPFASIGCLYDYNNDGMKDLCVGLQNSKRIIYLFPDKSYTFVKYDNDTKGSYLDIPSKMHDGKLAFYDALLTPFKNERPTPPTRLRAVQNEQAVVIEWNAGTDKETPAGGLRYNVSIKHKGAEGDGAYLISPLNGGNENCALPAPYYLPTATKFTVPLRSIPAGDYEVKIQSVDFQNETSAFSETLNITVKPSAVIDAPTSAMVGSEVEIKILTNDTDAVLDFGEDSEIVNSTETSRTVVWTTEGLKQVKFGSEIIAGIMVHPTIDASFSMPVNIGNGDLVTVVGDNVNKGIWEVLGDNGEYDSQSQRMKVEYSSADTLRIRVTGTEPFTLRHTITEDYGSATYEDTANVESRDVAIDLVTAHDGNYMISWNPAKAPGNSTGVIVLKETSSYNSYMPVAQVPVDAGYYIDAESDPRIKAERYKIFYKMPYGETAQSEAHKPLHVQINQGIGSAINLSWNKYEGIPTESYVILKGVSPETLEEYETISGSNTSFTDIADNAANSYYAIAIVKQPTGKATRASASSQYGALSNVVSGAEARNIILAEKILVSVVGGGNQFDGNKSVTLQARMVPTNATIDKVRWELAPDNDCMTVDEYGNVSALTLGKGKVRAYSVDGSDIYGEIELDNNLIPIKSLSFLYSVENLAAGTETQFIVQKTPENANETIVWNSTKPEVATVDEYGVVTAGLTETFMNNGWIYAKKHSDYCTISAGTEHSGALISKTVQVNVIPISEIEITARPENNQLKVGEQFQFQATYLPENATFKNEWKLDNPEITVASITPDGLVTALAPGYVMLYTYSPVNISPDANIYLEVVDNAGIEDISVDDNTLYDVYNLTGIKILDHGTRKDIENLSPGFYIVNGKKYMKK